MHQYNAIFTSDTKDLNFLYRRPLDLDDLNHILAVDNQYLFLGDDEYISLYDPEEDKHLWKIKMEKYDSVYSSFQYKNYIVVNVDSQRLLFVNKETGEVEITIKNGMNNRPCIIGDNVYFFSGKSLLQINIDKPKKKNRIPLPKPLLGSFDDGNADENMLYYNNAFWKIGTNRKKTIIEGIDIGGKGSQRYELKEEFEGVWSPLIHENIFYFMTPNHIIGLDLKDGQITHRMKLFPNLTTEQLEDDPTFRTDGMILVEDKIYLKVNILNQRNYFGYIDLIEAEPTIVEVMDDRSFSNYYSWALAYPLLGDYNMAQGPNAIYGISFSNVIRCTPDQFQAVRVEDDEVHSLEHKPACLAVVNEKLYCPYMYEKRDSNYYSGLLCFG